MCDGIDVKLMTNWTPQYDIELLVTYNLKIEAQEYTTKLSFAETTSSGEYPIFYALLWHGAVCRESLETLLPL